MRFTQKDAARMADLAGRGQDVKADLRDRATLLDGVKIVRPNHGESTFIYLMRTCGPDLLKLHPVHDVEVFPGADDRRVDFSFLPIPVVIEINGGVHFVPEKAESDWLKMNAIQLAGCMVLQYTPEQLERDPWPALEQIRQALAMMKGRTCSLAHKAVMGEDY